MEVHTEDERSNHGRVEEKDRPKQKCRSSQCERGGPGKEQAECQVPAPGPLMNDRLRAVL
jgi:hypothetical protein